MRYHKRRVDPPSKAMSHVPSAEGMCPPGGRGNGMMQYDISRNTAKNIINKGICSACDSDHLDVTVVGIQCWWCKLFFHATGCADECIVSSSTAFNNTLRSAVNNTSTFEGRFGRFLFVCDYCMTCKENEVADVNADRVALLEKKFDIMQNDFKKELSELKDLLKEQLNNSGSEHSLASSSTSSIEVSQDVNKTSYGSVWNDTSRVNNLKQMVIIKKDSNGACISNEKLEKILIENKIAVHKTTTLDKSRDTGILLNSRKDLDVLIDGVGKESPGNRVEIKPTLKPTISVVGLQRNYDKSELLDILKNQNPGISMLLQDQKADADDKFIDIINVSEIRAYRGKSAKLYKAIIRVSNLIRSVIAKQGNRVFLGTGSCKVYDTFYVLRCYNCQQFGHHSSRCENEAVCAHCSEGHQTLQCTSKSESSPSCANCKLASKSDHNHEAGSFDCPILI